MCKQTFSGHESDINAITVSECSVTVITICRGRILEIPVVLSEFVSFSLCLQCFDAVGWVAGRASGL